MTQTSDTTRAVLARWREMCEAAIDGPFGVDERKVWYSDGDGADMERELYLTKPHNGVSGSLARMVTSHRPTAELLAASRTALPALLDALEVAHEALRFYALYANYGAWLPNDDGPNYVYEPGLVELDEGKRAVKTLAAIAATLEGGANSEE